MGNKFLAKTEPKKRTVLVRIHSICKFRLYAVSKPSPYLVKIR